MNISKEHLKLSLHYICVAYFKKITYNRYTPISKLEIVQQKTPHRGEQ